MTSQDHETAEKMMSIFNVDFYDVWKSCWLACCIYRIAASPSYATKFVMRFRNAIIHRIAQHMVHNIIILP
jgi:galactitol-specific phosphotransferase system IIC component